MSTASQEGTVPEETEERSSTAEQRTSAEPHEIWEAATSMSHAASYFLARHVKDEREDDSIDNAPVGTIRLQPSLGRSSKAMVGIRLRAHARLESHIAIYEEGAVVNFDDTELFNEEDLQSFATEYVLPFLMPYVEAGLERICFTLKQPPPEFPLYIVNGRMYLNESAIGWGPDPEDESLDDGVTTT
jgi:hypothetical protein